MGGLGSMVAFLAACQPRVVEVEKEVTKIVKEVVKETVIVKGTPEVVEKVVTKVVEVTPVVKAEEPVELRVVWWGSQNRHTRTIGVIKMFEQKYPHIKMVYEFTGWGDHWTKLATQAAGGNLPDIMQHDYAMIAEWVEDGLLMSMDDYVDSGVLDFSNVADAALQGGRVEGKLYGVNLGTNSLCWIVDLDAFEKAGVDLPPVEWTWADFENVCLQIHDKLDIWAHAGNSIAHDHLWKAVIMSNREWVYSDDGKSLGYTDDQLMIDHFKMILRLQEAGAVQTLEEAAARVGGGLENDPVVTGESAMAMFWTNQIVAPWTVAGLDRNFKLLLIPRVEGGQTANYVKPSMFFSITRDAKHPKESAMFIDFFTNSVAANEILLAERGVPVSSVVREGLKPLLEKPQLEMFSAMALVETHSVPVPPPDPVGSADVQNNIYYPEFHDPVLYGQIAPEEGAAIFREMANEVLASK